MSVCLSVRLFVRLFVCRQRVVVGHWLTGARVTRRNAPQAFSIRQEIAKKSVMRQPCCIFLQLYAKQARGQPSGNGGSFSLDFGLFQGLKIGTIGVLSGCLCETSIFKIITIDDVTSWSVYSILIILFYRRTIFKMLALEQSPEKRTF